MEKIIIKKPNVVVKREDSTMVRIDKSLHERLKIISEETGYSVQYIATLLLTEAVEAVEIAD